MASRTGPDRGTGSNQYGDKAPGARTTTSSLATDANVRAVERLGVRPFEGTALAGDYSTRRPTAALVSDFEDSLSTHLASVGTGSLTATEVESSSLRLSRTEDAVLAKHQDLYGAAIIDAGYWKASSSAPAVADRISGGDEAGRYLEDAYDRVLADASGDREMSVDEMTTTLKGITKNKARWNQWQEAGQVPEETEESSELSYRSVALSVALSRSSSENPALQSELLEVQREMNEGRMRRINLG